MMTPQEIKNKFGIRTTTNIGTNSGWRTFADLERPMLTPSECFKKPEQEKGLPVVFMCLVGTLIENVNWKEGTYDFIPGVLEQLQVWDQKYNFVLISNVYKYIEEGLAKPLEIKSIVKKVQKEINFLLDTNIQKYGEEQSYVWRFGTGGDPILRTYVIDDVSNRYRKPLPTAAFEVEKEFNIDLSKSIMFGDGDNDKQFAENAGLVYVDVTEVKPK